MAEEKSVWETVADQALEYLISTRNISQWIKDIDPELENEESEPDFTQLDKMISDRQSAVNALKAVDVSALSLEPFGERERMSRDIAQDLFRQIAGLEEENQEILNGLGRKYREKLKNLKQSRETMETYGRQQVYGEGLQPDMMTGSYFNQAN